VESKLGLLSDIDGSYRTGATEILPKGEEGYPMMSGRTDGG